MGTRDSAVTFDRLEKRQLLAAAALHVNAGAGMGFTDSLARPFVAAGLSPAGGWFMGGRDERADLTPAIEGTTDDALFATARVGADFSFHASVNNGRYRVIVEFADTMATAAGQRVLDVAAEGVALASDLDVFARAGGATAYAVERAITITDGLLDLSFHADTGEAFVNAIVLVPTDAATSALPYTTANMPDSARVVISASQLRQIGIGLFLYSNERRGFYPDSLATVATGGYVPIDVFFNPRSNAVTARAELTDVEIGAVVRGLADYVYLGAGTKNNHDPADVFAYENPTRVAGAINVLFFDGHVETLSREAAATLIGFDASLPPTGAAAPPLGLTPDAAIAQSQRNQRAICDALRTYANSHSSRLPLALGDLIRTNQIAPSNAMVFSDPRRGASAMPSPPAGATTQEIAVWVDARSDYVLANPTLTRFRPGQSDPFLRERFVDRDGLSVITLGNGQSVVRESRWALEAFARFGPLPVEGDIDGDGAAGFSDLLMLAQYYGQSGRTYAEGNLDRSVDGVVGFDDLLILAQRYAPAATLATPTVAASAVTAPKTKRARVANA